MRHQCECRCCGSPLDGIRNLRLLAIPENVAPVLSAWTDNQVTIDWQPDNHASIYTAKWLRDHCYSEVERNRRKPVITLWDGSIEPSPPLFDFEQAESDPSVRLDLLEAVHRYGFCKLYSVPDQIEESGRVIRLVGSQRQTHYGTYNLAKKIRAYNVGDTTSALIPHSDETYRLSSIGITVFQVLQPSSSGGASTLVDGFEAVRRFRENFPSDFDLLTRLPITAERIDESQSNGSDPLWLLATLPVIQLDYEGEVSGVRLNERQISPLDLPAEQIDDCYRALRRLYRIVYDPELMITYHLQVGEGLIFDNQRLLHGRTAFNREDPPRSVLTSSVNIEDFHSSMRTLREQLEIDGPMYRYRQGLVS